MNAGAMMQMLGQIDGLTLYWAAPGRFTEPGVYYWDGKKNVRLVVPVQPHSEDPVHHFCHTCGARNQLPPLPSAKYGPDTHVDEDEELGAFTAEQMRNYAVKAICARSARSLRAPVDERKSFEAWAAAQWPNSNAPQNAWLGWLGRAEAQVPTPLALMQDAFCTIQSSTASPESGGFHRMVFDFASTPELQNAVREWRTFCKARAA